MEAAALRNLDSLEEKYTELMRSAQKHLKIMDERAAELSFGNASQAALIVQLKLEISSLKLESRRQAARLCRLSIQYELLIRMVRAQSLKLRDFMALDGRIALPALKHQSQPWWQRIARL